MFRRVVHTKDFAAMSDSNRITRRGSWLRAARLTALASVNGVQLVVVHHLAQLAQHLCRLAIAPATVSFFGAIVGQKFFESLDAFAAFYQMGDVDLSTEEVSHVAFVIVQRCDEKEVHEGYAISTAVNISVPALRTSKNANSLIQECFGNLLTGSQSFYQSMYAGRR